MKQTVREQLELLVKQYRKQLLGLLEMEVFYSERKHYLKANEYNKHKENLIIVIDDLEKILNG